MNVDRETYDARMGRFHEVCRATGLRMTAQRHVIYSALARSADHPSAETLHRRVRSKLPTVTLDTVYRTMETLEEAGLVERVSVVGSHMRFEANLDRHHHFVCRACNTITDVYSPALDGIQLPTELAKGYRVDRAHVELRGTCPKCKAARRK